MSQIIIGVAGELTNGTKGDLTVWQKKIWDGKVVKDFPDPFSISKGSFTMTVTKDGGSVETAVVYAGEESFWPLGFLITSAGITKVYVLCGKKSEIRIDWNEIETRIEQGQPSARYDDLATRTYITAKITSTTSGNYSVAATYGVA